MGVSPRLSTRVPAEGLKAIDDTARDMGVRRSEAVRRLLLAGRNQWLRQRAYPALV